MRLIRRSTPLPRRSEPGRHYDRSAGSAAFAAALLGVLLLAACTGNSGPSTPSARSSQPTATATARVTAENASGTRAAAPVPPSAPAPRPTQPPPPAGILLLQLANSPTTANCCSINQHSTPFTTTGSWDLRWNYDCGALGRPGNFGVDVYRGDGSLVADPAGVLVVGIAGQGVQAYGLPGTFTFAVNSVCAWSVRVTTSARPTATPVTGNSPFAGGSGVAPAQQGNAAAGGSATPGATAAAGAAPAPAAALGTPVSVSGAVPTLPPTGSFVPPVVTPLAPLPPVVVTPPAPSTPAAGTAGAPSQPTTAPAQITPAAGPPAPAITPIRSP